jgi:HK97 family phage portal protein
MFDKIFSKVKAAPQNLKFFKLLNGYVPVVANTNNTEAYYNYLMRACIRAIATHVAKADVKHIRYVNGDTIPQSSDLANTLSGQPNPYMNSSEFLFKLTTNLLIHNNAFVYIQEDAVGNVMGLYPLNSSFVTYMESSETTMDDTGNLFVKFNFRGGQEMVAPFEQIIHIKRDYFENDLMGSYNDNALYPLLQLTNTVHDGIINAVGNGAANLRGSLHFQHTLKLSDLQKKADEIMSRFFDINNNSGIIITDQETGEFKPFENKAILLDQGQMDLIQKQVFGYFNVNENIVFSNYTEIQFDGFFNSVISPILKQYSEAFTFKLFTARERGFGNKIIFTSNKLAHVSDATKSQMCQYAAPLGIFTQNELRQLFGLAPMPGGERRVESLNFVNVDIKDQYQMNQSTPSAAPSPAPAQEEAEKGGEENNG